jgi:hypothetical protein
MKKINWYNVNVLHSEEHSTVIEKLNKMGKYGRRKDIEPLINRLFKEEKETKQSIKHTEYMIKQFRAHFSHEKNDSMIENCDNLLKKLRNIL